MKTSTFFKQTFLCIALGLMSLTFNAQTTVNNNTNTSADFTSLQAAIDAATAGDVIYLQHSATSYGDVTIDVGVTIIGSSSGDNSYISQVDDIYLTNGASNTTVKGLQISDIRELGSGQVISDVAFIDCKINQTIVNLGLNNTYNNMLFQGNVIHGAITIRGNTSNILMTNNIILSSSLSFYAPDTLLFSNNILGYVFGPTISNQSTSLLTISNCIFLINRSDNRIANLNPTSGTIVVDNGLTYNYGVGNFNFDTGAGITINDNKQENIDPMFISVDTGNTNSIAASSSNFDPVNDNLRLQGGSTVVDDGLFQDYNFKNFGTPTGYPSIKILASTASVPKNGTLSVTIEAKTN